MSKTQVSELLKILDREIMTKKILSELNNYINLKDSIITVMKHLKQITNCDAIGIRIYDGKDYPFYACEGLPEIQISEEPPLCSVNPELKILKLSQDEFWSTKCICMDVIQGKADRNIPFFTSQGSFWANDLPSVLKTKDKHCIAAGFKSVALIRIMARDNCIGLIQLLCKSAPFYLDMILYLEMVGTYIGMAINNSLTYTRMKEAYDSLNQLIPMCSSCKKINTEEENWITIEEYLFQQTGSEFTHTICPECIEELYPALYHKLKEKENKEEAFKAV